MIVTYVSSVDSPHGRGEEFGVAHSGAISRTVERYARLFTDFASGPVNLQALGLEALRAIEERAPDAAAEILGIAVGAGVDPWAIALLNARTEVLARLGAVVHECSTLVALGPGNRAPLSVQTWDWHDIFADGSLIWTIPHSDGTVVHTFTEYGILGKIGVNSHGVGVHLNILHHASDGGPIGMPVHVLARTVLDRARDAGQAAAMVGAAELSASSVLTLVTASPAGKTALAMELSPAGPGVIAPGHFGELIHTNHFLDPRLAAGDREPRVGPDSFIRLEVLTRALAAAAPDDREAMRRLMANHVGGAGAVCRHSDPGAPLLQPWRTLAMVALDVAAGTLAVREGYPCTDGAEWFSPPELACPSESTPPDLAVGGIPSWT